MKLLSINTGWQTERYLFADDGKADAAYFALKEAMQAYERFGNDKAQSVSVMADVGEMTFRVEFMHSLGIEDLSEARDAVYVESAQRNARLKTKVEQVEAAKPEVHGVNSATHDGPNPVKSSND